MLLLAPLSETLPGINQENVVDDLIIVQYRSIFNPIKIMILPLILPQIDFKGGVQQLQQLINVPTEDLDYLSVCTDM